MVCEVRGVPAVRVALRLSTATGAVVGIEIGDVSLFGAASPIDPQPISARLLRKIPLGALERMARDHLRWELASRAHSGHPDIEASLDRGGHALREALTANHRPGRRGHGDLAYAALAARYVARLGSGREVQELKEDLEQEGRYYSRNRIRNMLSDARTKGLLTRPPVPGKSGGRLTERAIALLKSARDSEPGE